jgi:hypothetical protein
MHKIDSEGHNNNTFINEDALHGIVGTKLDADWLNAVQSEIIAVLIEANITPQKATTTQLRDAIKQIVADGATDHTHSNYALKNGNASQTFKVADATANDEAVNLSQLNDVNGADDVFNLQPIQTLGAISNQTDAIAQGFILLNGATIDISGYNQTQKDKLHSLVTGDYVDVKTAYTQNSSITTINADEYFARVDSSRSLGDLQDDELKSHNHTAKIAHYCGVVHSAGTEYRGVSSWASASVDSYGGIETRPKNINTAKYWGLYIGF